jgi:DNA polymerase-3 subunit delta'
MQFKDVVGQGTAKRNLVQMWQGGRMPHALLLLGREGTGGLPLALAFAQYVLCEAKTSEDSCGQCANCHKVQRLEHADLHLSFPSIRPKSDKPAKSAYFMKEFRDFVHESPYGTTYEWLQSIEAENKQGNISAEECRDIIDALSLKSYEGGAKIQIIWRPEYLGKEGNILLKLIEEPPVDTLLLFVAENTEDILPTILSRTQMVRLPPVMPADIAAGLQQRGLADERKAVQIGQMADGSFMHAMQLVEQVEDDLLPAVRDWFNGIFTGNGIKLVQFTEKWSKAGREGIRHLLSFTLSLLEGALRVAYLPEAINTLSPQEGEFAQRLASRALSVESIQGMIDAITDASYHIERNAHSKSVLMALSVKMQRALRATASR